MARFQDIVPYFDDLLESSSKTSRSSYHWDKPKLQFATVNTKFSDTCRVFLYTGLALLNFVQLYLKREGINLKSQGVLSAIALLIVALQYVKSVKRSKFMVQFFNGLLWLERQRNNRIH